MAQFLYKWCTYGEITTEQNHARDSSKNVRFLCYEGFSIFTIDFKGSENVIFANISISQKVKPNQKSRVRFFTTLLHSNKLKSKNFVTFGVQAQSWS